MTPRLPGWPGKAPYHWGWEEGRGPGSLQRREQQVSRRPGQEALGLEAKRSGVDPFGPWRHAFKGLFWH